MTASNLALNGVEIRQAGLVMVRYADDAVVLCRTVRKRKLRSLGTEE
jgi:hypothetical protein